MEYKAALLALVLVSGSLAGCTSDPDGGGNAEFDSEALQDLIDENLQDFLNNTTITVNNHYYNNTTYVVDDGDYSTNNYNSSAGSGSGDMLYLLDVFFTMEELLPDYEAMDHRNNTINYSYTYYDYLPNSQRTDGFLIQCSDYYIVGSLSTGSTFQASFWNDSSNYRDAWDNEYNDTISDMLYEAGNANYFLVSEYGRHVRMACDEYYAPGGGWDDVHLMDIPIPNGMAIDLVTYESYAFCHEEGRWTGDNYPDGGGCQSDWDNDGDLRPWYNEYFRVDLVWEGFTEVTTSYPLWIGGDGATVLSVYLDDLYPNQQYRLRIYFETITVLNVEE